MELAAQPADGIVIFGVVMIHEPGDANENKGHGGEDQKENKSVRYHHLYKSVWVGLMICFT